MRNRPGISARFFFHRSTSWKLQKRENLHRHTKKRGCCFLIMTNHFKYESNQMQPVLFSLKQSLASSLTSLSRTLMSFAKRLHCSSMSSTLISLQVAVLHAAMLDSTIVIMSQSSFSKTTSRLCQGQAKKKEKRIKPSLQRASVSHLQLFYI